MRSPDFQNRHGVGSFRATSCLSLSFQGLTRKRTPQLSVTMGWALVNRPTWQTPLNHGISQPNHGIAVEIDRKPPPHLLKCGNPMGFNGETQGKPYILWGKHGKNPWCPIDFPGIFLRVTHGFPRAARLVTMSPLSPSTFSLSKVVSRCPMLLADLD